MAYAGGVLVKSTGRAPLAAVLAVGWRVLIGDEQIGSGGVGAGKGRPERRAARHGGDDTAAGPYDALRPYDAVGGVRSSDGMPLLGSRPAGQHALHACPLLASHGATPPSLSRYAISRCHRHAGVGVAQNSAASICQSLRCHAAACSDSSGGCQPCGTSVMQRTGWPLRPALPVSCAYSSTLVGEPACMTSYTCAQSMAMAAVVAKRIRCAGCRPSCHSASASTRSAAPMLP